MDDTAASQEQPRGKRGGRRRLVVLDTLDGRPLSVADALRESEGRFRTLAEGSLQGIIVHRNHRPLFVNPAYAHIFGYKTPDEILQMETIVPLFAPDDRLRLVRYNQARHAGHDAPTQYECQMRRRDGTLIWLESRVSVVQWGGEPATLVTLFEITTRKKAQKSLMKRMHQLEAIRLVSAEIIRELDLTSLLRLILRRTLDLIKVAESSCLYLWEEGEQALVPRAWQGIDDWVGGIDFRLGEGVTGTVAKGRTGMIVNDYQTCPYAHPLFLQRHGTTALLVEPLLYRERLSGVIVLGNHTPGQYFTPEDRTLLSLFAAQAAIAIENARLFAEAAHRRHIAEYLAAAGRAFLQSLDSASVAQLIADSLRLLFDAQGSVLYRLDPSSGDMVALTVSGYTAPVYRPGAVVPRDTGSIGLAVRQQQAVASSDLLVDPRLTFAPAFRASLEHFPPRAVLSVPLLVQDRVIGVLAVSVPAGRIFTAEEKHMAQAFADQAALAMENARLYTETQKTRDFLQSIAANSADAILTTDVRGDITYCSPGAEAIFGWSAAEMIGRPAASYYQGGSREAHSVMQCLRREGQYRNYETVVRGRNRWVTVNASLSLLRDEHGHITGTLGVFRDITAEKCLEREILEVSSREQQRLGQDLHDGLGQVLLGLALLSKGLAQKLEARGLPEATQALQITAIANQALTQTRDLVRGLYPAELKMYGLVDALRTLSANAENVFDISCRVITDATALPTDDAVALHLYRIVQEAVNNAIRHGRAQVVEITLMTCAEGFRLSVQDTGRGFSPEQVPTQGMGIRIMRYRAHMIGAELEIRRAAGGGTCVICTLPLSAPALSLVAPQSHIEA